MCGDHLRELATALQQARVEAREGAYLDGPAVDALLSASELCVACLQDLSVRL
jgi:hypothetical protein